MKSFLIGCAWLLGVPLVVVLGLLATQGGDEDWNPPAPPAQFSPPAAAPVREFRFLLRDAAGAAPAGAVVLAIEPELAPAEVTADGAVTVRLREPGPVRLLAWAPGCEVSEGGPWSEPPTVAWVLPRLAEVAAARAAPLALVERHLRISDAGGKPLAHALVLLRSAEEPAAAPWVGFADAEGTLTLSATPGASLIEVFAPGHAAAPAWRVAEARLEADAPNPAPISAACAELRVRGLSAGEAAELLRDGQVMARAVADAAGEVRWRDLPIAAWDVRIETGETMHVGLEPSGTTLLWQ